jgi:hypothetical protein
MFEFEPSQIKQLTSEIEKSLKTITDRVNPMGNKMADVIKQFTPISTQTININGEQVAVSKLNDNRILLKFKDIANENTFINSLNQKKSISFSQRIADLIYAIRCLFS